jgi:hypothetical protein
VSRRTLEETGKRKGELNNPQRKFMVNGGLTRGRETWEERTTHLQRVASLEGAPNEYGRERYCIAVRYMKLSDCEKKKEDG